MRGSIVETITGAVVIAVTVIFFVFAYRVSGVSSAAGGYTVDARFGGVSGLVTGADVRVSGIKVGTVVDQRLDTETFDAIVTMSIAPEVKLPKDSSAKIATDGLLGGAHVALDPGGEKEMMAPGDTIEYTQGAVDLMSLIGQAVFGGGENR